jgi:hypothetical protein
MTVYNRRYFWAERRGVLPTGTTRVAIVPAGGQSLGLGVGATDLVTSTPISRTLGQVMCFSPGPRVLQVDPTVSNKDTVLSPKRIRHIINSREIIEYGNDGETPMSRFGDWYANARGATESVIVATAGVGDTHIADLVTGAPLQNFKAVIMQAVGWVKQQSAISVAAGGSAITPWVPGVIWKHGPADAAIAQQTYYDALVAHQAAIQTFVQSATGQAENVPFVMTQDSGDATFHQSQPQLAQLNAALNLPQRFVMWGPDYDLNHYNGSLHLFSAGYAKQGERYAIALLQYLTWQAGGFTGTSPALPMRMISAALSGNNITVTFNQAISDVTGESFVVDHSPESPLVNLGFDLIKPHATTDAANDIIFPTATIASVGSPSGSTIVVTKSGTLSANTLLGLARQTTDGAIKGGPGWGSPRTPIRGVSRATSLVDGQVHYWRPVHQEIAITGIP